MAPKVLQMAPKGSKITPKGFKVGPNGPKMQQTALKPPSKALQPPYNPSVYFRRSRAMNTLREPFGDLPTLRSTLRGHSFTLWVALNGLGRAKKRPYGPFLALPRQQCLKFSPKKGQNRPKWVKMLSKLLKTPSKVVKTGSKGVKTA